MSLLTQRLQAPTVPAQPIGRLSISRRRRGEFVRSSKRVRIAAVFVASAVASFLTVVGARPAPADGTPLPARVFAPYFETWSTDSIAGVAQQSGARYFTLAFLETLGKTSCTLAWNGERAHTLATGRYLSDIAALR